MFRRSKQICILSDGSIIFSYGIKSELQCYIFEKDNINLSLNKKETTLKVTSDSFKKYKNKYLK